MLREVPGDCDVEIPYWDPKLKYNQKAYQKLVCRLHRQNYFLYTLYPIFFVLKSDGERLRLISDARIPNQTDFWSRRRSNFSPVRVLGAAKT